MQCPLIARWRQQTALRLPVSHQKVLRHCKKPQVNLGVSHPRAGIRDTGEKASGVELTLVTTPRPCTCRNVAFLAVLSRPLASCPTTW